MIELGTVPFPRIGYEEAVSKRCKSTDKSGKEENFDFKILKATESVHKKKKVILVDEIEKYFGGITR